MAITGQVIGSHGKCSDALAQILTKSDDFNLSKKVTNLYHEACYGFNTLSELKTTSQSGFQFRNYMLHIFYMDLRNRVEQTKFPILVKNHLLCCIAAAYRKKLRLNKFRIKHEE